ncbi:hypothetical protein GS539_19330 [Rhodococcus hoagii]|nr:hypothetical protein [Prescottella equi]
MTHKEAEGFVTVLQRHYPDGEAVLLASLRHRLDTPPAVSVPDSGPDGTPEKPWPRAADVPDGMWFRSAKNRHWPPRWLRCGNSSTDYADMANPKPSALGYQVWHESAVNDHAPFVRVDGDEA